MSQVYITDTILRDAHQCLIATRLRTDDMLGICDKLDSVGFWSLEVWGGATFDACVRFLREDPWERLIRLRKALPNTRLQMLLRGQNLLGYRHYPDDVVRLFVQKAADNGIDVFRIFDALNDIRNCRVSIESVKAAGKHAQGAIAYTTSPVHGIDQFIKMALDFQNMGCDSIAIKDMAGLLTPLVTTHLVSELIEKCQVPIHLHVHATAGLASLCHMKAIEAGCCHIDTAISAFAEGASHPCTESMVVACQDTPFDTGLDLSLLQSIGSYFREVRKKYQRFETSAQQVDTRVQAYQVPGGMISNLHNQLRMQNALDKLEDVQEEIPRVRADLGYPPLVTPTSQIVGTQALLNVLTGERYKSITNEVKAYCQGRYGKAPGKVNASVQQQAIGNEAVIDCRPADLLDDEMNDLRKAVQDVAKSQEDVLIYAMFPDLGREFLQQRNSGTLQPEPLDVEQDIAESATSVKTKPAPTDFKITLHGETYAINITGTGDRSAYKRAFYVTIDGVLEEILVEQEDGVHAQDEKAGNGAGQGVRLAPASQGDVTTAMPGVVVDVLVKKGDQVAAGEPILVVEAMKMETEIQSPIAGIITAVHVAKGDAVNPNEVLVSIQPDATS